MKSSWTEITFTRLTSNISKILIFPYKQDNWTLGNASTWCRPRKTSSSTLRDLTLILPNERLFWLVMMTRPNIITSLRSTAASTTRGKMNSNNILHSPLLLHDWQVLYCGTGAFYTSHSCRSSSSIRNFNRKKLFSPTNEAIKGWDAMPHKCSHHTHVTFSCHYCF